MSSTRSMALGCPGDARRRSPAPPRSALGIACCFRDACSLDGLYALDGMRRMSLEEGGLDTWAASAHKIDQVLTDGVASSVILRSALDKDVKVDAGSIVAARDLWYDRFSQSDIPLGEINAVLSALDDLADAAVASLDEVLSLALENEAKDWSAERRARRIAAGADAAMERLRDLAPQGDAALRDACQRIRSSGNHMDLLMALSAAVAQQQDALPIVFRVLDDLLQSMPAGEAFVALDQAIDRHCVPAACSASVDSDTD